jgi:hypothetical protein
MKDQQSSLENSVEAVDNGESAPKRWTKWRNWEDRLQRLETEYNNGTRNLEQYWNAVYYAIVQFWIKTVEYFADENEYAIITCMLYTWENLRFNQFEFFLPVRLPFPPLVNQYNITCKVVVCWNLLVHSSVVSHFVWTKNLLVWSSIKRILSYLVCSWGPGGSMCLVAGSNNS